MRSLMNQNGSFREQPQTQMQRKPLPDKERGQLRERESDETVILLSVASFGEKQVTKEISSEFCCHTEFSSGCHQECIRILLIVKMDSSFST